MIRFPIDTNTTKYAADYVGLSCLQGHLCALCAIVTFSEADSVWFGHEGPSSFGRCDCDNCGDSEAGQRTSVWSYAVEDPTHGYVRIHTNRIVGFPS